MNAAVHGVTVAPAINIAPLRLILRRVKAVRENVVEEVSMKVNA